MRGNKGGSERSDGRRKWKAGENLDSPGVCLDKSSSGRAEDYGIIVSVVGHVSRRGQH